MEKDKMILECLQTIRENNSNLEQTNKLLILKDEGLSKARDDIKELKFKLKSNHLIKNEEEIKRFKNNPQENINELTKDEKLNQGFILNLQQHNEMKVNKKLIKSNEIHKIKMDNNYSILKQKIMKNSDDNKQNYKNEFLINSNLKKTTDNCESLFEEINMDYAPEKEKFKTFNLEKEVYDKRICEINELLSEESSIENIKMIMNDVSFELEVKIKENENHGNYSNTVLDKYKSSLKEKDILLDTFENELGKYIIYLETLINNNNKINDEIVYSKVITKKLNFSKFDLINKNFEILKRKVHENHNNKINQIEKLTKNIKELESKNIEKVEEKNSLTNDNYNKNQVISDLNEKLSKLNLENEQIKEIYKEIHEGLMKENKVLVNKYEKINNDYQNFIYNTFNLLNNKFPNEDMSSLNNSNESFKKTNEITSKIKENIEIILNENTNLKIKENESTEKLKTFQTNYKNLEEQNNFLLSRFEENSIAIIEESNKEDKCKIQEIKKHREILYDKINSLTKLLEECNSMISEYETENLRLKKMCQKYEYNLKMLTESHMLLEDNIKSNFDSLNVEIEQKDYKFNQILRELELKEVNITYLESLMKRKEEEIENLKHNQKLYLNTSSKNNNLNTDIKIDDNSQKLKKNDNLVENNMDSRLNYMGIDKKIDSKIGTDESYPIKNQSTSKIIESHEIKIPGKIYSKRKIHNN